MPLDRNEVEHLARLARIGLTDEEAQVFTEQLSHILAQFEVLRELDTSGVVPTAHVADLESVTRADLPGESLAPEDVLSNVPRRQGDLIRVKAVLED
jgi:aspartyl-tRNA(Asn)/glutamyl-tRNA(Gln) amidotransferase subunit C